MTGINKAPICLDLETDYLLCTSTLIEQKLGKGNCIAVIIQNRLTNDDATGNALELMVGKGNGQIWNMLPGQESPVIYANDLEEIYIRTRVAVAGGSTFQFVVMVYRQKRETR